MTAEVFVLAVTIFVAVCWLEHRINKLQELVENLNCMRDEQEKSK